MVLRSRGRGIGTATGGPSVAAGPIDSGMIRSASSRASSTSLVISTTVFLLVSQMRAISSCSVARVSASSADSGSSISSTSGSADNARASATRCRIPPDSSDGRLSRAGARFTSARCSSACARFLSRGQSANRWSTARYTFSNAVNQGSSE